MKSVYDFAYVHHTPEHIEIVNITKHPVPLDSYIELEIRRKESPNIVIYCKKDCIEQVLDLYRNDNHA